MKRILAMLVLVASLTPLHAATPPEIALPDLEGKTATLAEYRGKSPVLLVFYRGYW